MALTCLSTQAENGSFTSANGITMVPVREYPSVHIGGWFGDDVVVAVATEATKRRPSIILTPPESLQRKIVVSLTLSAQKWM